MMKQMALRGLSDEQMEFIYDRLVKKEQWPLITSAFMDKWEDYRETLNGHKGGAKVSLQSKYKGRKKQWLSSISRNIATMNISSEQAAHPPGM